MMRGLRKRLARLVKDDAGLSMSELLVAAILTSLLLIMVGTMFIQTTKLVSAAGQTRTSNGTASTMSNGITSVLRTATTIPKSGSEIPTPAIVSGTRNSLSILAYSETDPSNPTPTKVTFSIVTLPSGLLELQKSVCTGVLSGGFWTFTGCTSTVVQKLGVGILNGTGDTLFAYRTGSGDPIVIGNTPLTAAQRESVGSIVVTVKVRAPDSTNDPVVITSTVVLRNLGLDTGTSS